MALMLAPTALDRRDSVSLSAAERSRQLCMAGVNHSQGTVTWRRKGHVESTLFFPLGFDDKYGKGQTKKDHTLHHLTLSILLHGKIAGKRSGNSNLGL